MSHSTHVGFSAPPVGLSGEPGEDSTTSFSGRELWACVSGLAFPLRQSLAAGVGHLPGVTTAVRRL